MFVRMYSKFVSLPRKNYWMDFDNLIKATYPRGRTSRAEASHNIQLENSYGQAIGLANNFGLGPNGLGLSPGCPNAIAASNFGAPGFVNNFPLNNLGGNIAPLGYPLTGLGPVGYGDVSVLGELPVGGSTIVNGNLPVIGYVTFEGIVPAGGLVSVANGCGCNQLAF